MAINPNITVLIKKHIFCLTIIIIVLSLISCQNKPLFVKNPEQHIVRLLQKKRIVMLSDFQHSNAFPYRSLIMVLEKWLQMVREDSQINRNLALILEEDDQIIELIKNFINTGNWQPVSEFWLPYSSLEMFEFYFDLRCFSETIDSLNTVRPLNDRIVFDLYGGEPFNLFNNIEQLGASKIEGLRFFVNKRDSLIADRISTYLIRNPLQKAIIFYGSGHLIKNRVKKRVASSLPGEESKGYYLAYYLKQKFGQNSVLSVTQTFLPKESLIGTQFEQVKAENIFTLSENTPWKYMEPENYDAFIVRHEPPTPTHPFRNIFSRYVIEQSLNKLDFLEPHLNGYQATVYYKRALNALNLITGQDFSNAKDWQNWYNHNKFDGFYRLQSAQFSKYVYNEYCKSRDDLENMRELYWLGFGPAIFNSQEFLSQKDWNSVWKEVLRHVIFLNSIGTSWVGYPEERETAREYLLEFSNRDFAEPAMYLKWWRSNYYNATY